MAIAFVQSKSATLTGAVSATFTSAPNPGNILIAFIYQQGTTLPTMVSTGWTALTTISSGSAGTAEAAAMFWKIAVTGESSTVTSGNALASAMAIAEYNSLGLEMVVDINNIQNNAAAASQPTPSVTPLGGEPALAVCFAAQRGTTATYSAETIGGLTATEREDTAQGSIAANMALYDLIISSTAGSYAGAATSAQTNAVGDGGIIIFRFKAPPLNN